MSTSLQIKQAVQTAIEELESSFGSDYPSRSDVNFKSLSKTLGAFDDDVSPLSGAIESVKDAHVNYCIAYEDMEAAKDEYQNTPADSEEEEEADQRHSDAMEEFSNEGGRLTGAIQDVKFALQDFERKYKLFDAA
ncbi:MAG: hypothetical protein CL840_15375 [Crocinitomicaceae bacterium]|nr:hypothetical protein [Crocinitomicaceae bacterium]|tara:strand:+ start:3949 stop:4353 length:405 start_codon:yes stop_codon:yes gene_type:complete